MRDWADRHQGWLWGAAFALVILVFAGFAVRDPVKDWWLAREACGGKLPGGDLETVRTDARLGSQEESFDEHSGRYSCVLTNDEGKVVVAVDAYPTGQDRDHMMRYIGNSYTPRAVLPGGLPGFEADHSTVHLMPECPRHAAEPSRQRHRLLVKTWTSFAESREEKAAMLRLAVRMTNEMTEKLGCGGEPLPEPKRGAVPSAGTHLPRAEAQGTACNALATTQVPAEGRRGKVRVAIAEGGVVGRCTLYAPREAADDRYGDDGPAHGRPLVELTMWRGEWGRDMRERGSGPTPLPLGRGAEWKPALTEARAWAVARCDGENVGFAAHWGDDFGYRATGKEAKPRGSLREYVTAFAEDQVRRGNCTGLQVP